MTKYAFRDFGPRVLYDTYDDAVEALEEYYGRENIELDTVDKFLNRYESDVLEWALKQPGFFEKFGEEYCDAETEVLNECIEKYTEEELQDEFLEGYFENNPYFPEQH